MDLSVYWMHRPLRIFSKKMSKIVSLIRGGGTVSYTLHEKSRIEAYDTLHIFEYFYSLMRSFFVFLFVADKRISRHNGRLILPHYQAPGVFFSFTPSVPLFNRVSV